jgi:lactoylglutathione lyase
MSEALQSIGAITLFVEDRARAKGFYETVFDVPVLNEDEDSVAFRFEHLIVNLLVEQAAPDLIGPARVATREAGARFQLTIWVDDTDAVCAELASRGVELLNGPTNRDWGVRTAAFADPDGHVWELAGKIPS